MLPTVTRRFINGIIRDGRLTEARLRYERGTAEPARWVFESATCWNIVCEEVIDTDHDPGGYDAVFAELIRRGFTLEEIDEMRRIAWRTAGWLNYDLMLWDWVSLDEGDMREALELQLKKGKIKKDDFEEDLLTIQQFLERDTSLKPIQQN